MEQKQQPFSLTNDELISYLPELNGMKDNDKNGDDKNNEY